MVFAHDAAALATQRLLFRSPDELARARLAAVREAQDRIRAARKLEQELAGAKDAAPDAQYVTVAEQATLLRFYEAKVADYCAHLALDSHVLAAAVTLFKRFYVRRTVMEHDPKIFVLASIFLASKIELSTQYLALDAFLRKIPKPPDRDEILRAEFVLAEATGFCFRTQSVFWAAHGLFLEIQDDVANNDVRGRLYKRVLELVRVALRSDLPLLFFPSQIALACFEVACLETGQGDEWEAFLARFVRSQTLPENLTDDELEQRMLRIKAEVVALLRGEMAADGAPADKEQLKAISGKLATCRNPELVETSLVYKKRRADEQRALADARRKRSKTAPADDFDSDSD